jgi:hypothetical protein
MTPKYFQTYSPRVRVLVKDLETAQVLYDISDDLTSLSTNKAYGRCSGTWQLMLPYRKWQRFGDEYVGYMDVLQPNQMLTVEMDAGNGAGFFPVMCGMIDRVSAFRQGGDVPQRAVKVSGRDMGKLLETHDIAFDIIAYSGAAKILWNRYRNNHTYESGSVVVHLRPDIRVGNGLLIQQLDGSYKEYFIEQVSHQCVFNPRPQFFTTLQLTRGQKSIPRNAENAGKPTGGQS